MYRAFQHFDTDNSGTISQAELREALRVSTAPAASQKALCVRYYVHALCAWSTFLDSNHQNAGCSDCPGWDMLRHQAGALLAD